MNSRLLDKLARENFGQSEYVRPNEDIEARVSRLYNRIELAGDDRRGSRSSTSTRAKTEDGQPVNRVYPKDVFDLFAGEQLVLVGRYKKPGTAKVIVTGKVGGEQQKLRLPGRARRADRPTRRYAFVEKLWAMRRDRRDHRRARPEGQERRTGQGAGRAVDEARHPHAVHVVPGRRDNAAWTTWRRTRRGRSSACGRSPRAEGSRRRAAEGQGRAPAGRQRRAGRGRIARLGAAAGGTPARVYRDDAADKDVVVENVRNIGDKCFYSRGEQWVDSTVSDELAKKARHVKQFSDDYFKLAEKHGKDLSQYLALDEPVLVNLAGEACLIEPAGE